MDGTLTNAIHDFDAIRAQLGLPAGLPILESIARLPTDEAADISAKLDALELEIAAQATQQPGAEALLQQLAGCGHQLGILTRNGKAIAHATLAACGLEHYFAADDVISRDCCAPKPEPAGVELLLERWNANAEKTVMVGDYLFDLQAGASAGTHTVHLSVDGQFHWPDITSAGVTSLTELSKLAAR